MSEKDSKDNELENGKNLDHFDGFLNGDSNPAQLSPRAEESDESFLEVDDRQAEEMRQIFGASFPQYLQPIEEILEQIFSGKGEQDSVETVLGIINSLLTASSRMGLSNIHEALTQLSDRITALDKTLKEPPGEEAKKGISAEIAHLKRLATEMAGVDSLEIEKSQRTIRSVLKEREGIGELVIKRLNVAGLVTVDQILMGRPEEIAAVSGLDIEIVRRVVALIKGDDKEKEKKRERSDARIDNLTSENKSRQSASSEVDALREQVLGLLQQESDERITIEKLKVEIEELRARLSSFRETARNLTVRTKEKKKAINRLTKQTKKRTVMLSELEEERSEFERKFAFLKESVYQKEIRAKTLQDKQRGLEEQSNTINRDIERLIGSLGQINRAAKR
jgi:hypothetical protein